LFEDIFKDRPITRVRELRCEDGDNENRLFPFGMEPELGPEMPFVLLYDLKGRNTAAVL